MTSCTDYQLDLAGNTWNSGQTAFLPKGVGISARLTPLQKCEIMRTIRRDTFWQEAR